MRPQEPRVGDKCGRQMGDKCKLMRPKAPRVRDKGETSVNSCGPRHPRVGDKEETSVNSCGPRHPEWETSVGDKCKLMRPKNPE